MTSLKSKPSPLIRCVSWSQKPFTLETMSFQMPVMAVRNSSLVFQRFMKAATSVPMTATTATTGPDRPPRTTPSLLNTPLALPTWVMRSRTPFARELNTHAPDAIGQKAILRKTFFQCELTHPAHRFFSGCQAPYPHLRSSQRGMHRTSFP